MSPSDTTLESKVDFLMGRVELLEARLGGLEAESPQRLAELRRTMEEHVARELTAALKAYRPLRIAGTFSLAIGLACVTAATLLAGWT